MSDPLHTRVCLTGLNCSCPSISFFVVPEPLVRGGQMLHLLEQAPVAGRIPEPKPDTELIELIEAVRTPLSTRGLAHLERVAFAGPRHDPPTARTVLHDHLIEEPQPWGLDVDDPAELVRLDLLPEHRIGPRRIDDFQAHSVRQAMAAVYRYFGIDQRIPLVYHGFADPLDGWFALRASAA
ncbi:MULTISPECIES: hypothetical protein [Nocardia]|jgi:hypothetical protein|uniref:hypothetical protein n=1 Tax=Nocardia TaxID=1817 RepID=UPI0029316D83|nr:hypothetical protein [Nocardia canadensis]